MIILNKPAMMAKRLLSRILNLLPKNRLRRDLSLDILRGIAVFFMLLAHSVFFLYAGENGLLRGAKIIGDTFCFGAFLFVSGTVTYLAYLRQPNRWMASKNRLLRRSLVILAGYYVVAVVASLRDFGSLLSAQWLRVFWQVISVQKLPGFTEFLIPLVIFRLLLFPLRKFYSFILKTASRVVVTAVLVYSVGAMLYPLRVPGSVLAWKALLVGQTGWYTFPLLQYFPVFLLGLVWGRWVLVQGAKEDREKRAFRLGLILGFISVLAFVISVTGQTTASVLFERWPPSPLFLVIGLAGTFLLIAAGLLVQELKIGGKIVRGTLFLGRHAFPVFIAHSLLLHIYKVMGLPQFGHPLVVIIGFFLLLLLSSYLAAVKVGVYLWLGRIWRLLIQKLGWEPKRRVWERFVPGYLLKRKRRRLKKRYLVIALTTLFILLSVVTIEDVLERTGAVPWWNDGYSFHRVITVSNTDFLNTLSTGATVMFRFNHSQLVQEAKSLNSGDDIRIVWWNGDSYRELSYGLQTPWNLLETVLAIKIQADILPHTDDNHYYLYYGNRLAETPVETAYRWLSQTLENLQLNLGSEVSYPVLGVIDKHWVLKGDGFTLDDTRLEYRVQIRDDLPLGKDVTVQYEIPSLGQKGKLSQLTNRGWGTTIDVSDLPVGSYQIKATVSGDGVWYTSQQNAFFISFPLYVVWSIDWEGYDVAASALQALAQIAERYEIPLTHMFNPRIYTSGKISASRSEYLTNWVKERQSKYGDEIGLHLHMFPDLVADAGVETKNLPRWGGWEDGYDVLVSAYDYEETVKLITRSKELFKLHGLGTPVSFRAGGWFADIDTLRAVDTTGFYLDTSGRDKYVWGTNKIPGFWNLTPTTQPYQPSKDDQNQSRSENMSIWEFPNNGGSSYDLTKEEMIVRFKDNFVNRKPLLDKRVITYLSHPQWFSVAEQQRVDGLFGYIDGYLLENDSGPVRYVTLDQAYQAWAIK